MAASRNPFENSFISVDHSLHLDDDSSAAFSDSVSANDHDIESSGERLTSKNNSPSIATDGRPRRVSNWSRSSASDIDNSTRTCPAKLNSSLEYDIDTSRSGPPQVSRQKSFLTYGAEFPIARRRSVFNLPTQFVSKDGGETCQPVGSSQTTSTRSTKSRYSFQGNSYNQKICKQKKQDPEDISTIQNLPNYDFLDTEKSKDQSSVLPTAKWWHGVFFFSLIAVLMCIITLWAPYPFGARMPTEMVAETPWSDGCKNMASCICPRETICADDLLAMILLTISRCSVWFDYPLYMCLFLSKCNNINNKLQKTVLRCWANFSDYHKVHRLFGIVVGVESASHSFFHLLRWARRNDDIQLLWTSQTGITGLVALICSFFIVLPMTVPFLKNAMTYEWRKGLHYLSIVWAAGLMAHAPQRIFWLIGAPFILYLMDKAIEVFQKTHLIESAQFERLSDTFCTITFENPPGFGKQNSAYVYLMLPWLSRSQFHAFTVFPGRKPNHSSICISKCGNWTESLMKEITTPTHKPAFLMGPYLSPFSSPAMDSVNVVAVASGIGVTPAFSLIKQYASTTRRMNLIWICRDAALVEHFLQSLDAFETNGYLLIYYTGKRQLFLNDDLPTDVVIFNGRPDLEKTISAIIYSTASGNELPEDLFVHNSTVTKVTTEVRTKLLLEKALSIYSIDQLFEYSVHASGSSSGSTQHLFLLSAGFDGILTMMKNLLGDDFELSSNKTRIMQTLDSVDSYGSSILTRDMFQDFMQLVVESYSLQKSVDSTKDSKLGSESMDIKRVSIGSVNDMISNGKFGVKKYLLGEFSSKKWNLLYCGGSEPVLAQLKAYKANYSIELSVEKFDW